MPGKSKFQISRSLDERIKRIVNGSSEYQGSEFAQVNSAYILGFNYGNVTNCVGLTTNYQLHHAVFPVVGLVFFKTSPSDEDIKSSLKCVREFSSSPNGLGSFKSDKNEHLFLIYSVTESNSSSNERKDVEKRIFNFTKGTFVRRRRLRLNILNDPYCPRQVHKGPDDLLNIGDNDSLSSADDDQIDHLIFFIHGVGGVCDVRFRSCVEVVADFKKMANNLLAQQSNPSSGASTPSSRSHYYNAKRGSFFRKKSTDSNSSSREHIPQTKQRDRLNSSPTISSISPIDPPLVERTRRVECLPVSWHSCSRRQIGVNDQLSMISLSSVPKLRHFLNKVVLDALLYTSGPVYTQTIVNNVGDEINRLYTLFMEKHPNFTGSISLAGHSLGCVILFDLLANQVPEGANDVASQQEEETNNNVDSSSRAVPLQSCLNVSHHHHTTRQSGSCMDYNNLDELLTDMNLTQYANTFQKEHIDINTLLLLTDFDMKELNLPLGVRRKLSTYINFKKVSLKSRKPNPISTATASNNDEQHTSASTTSHANNNLCDNTGQYLVKYPQLKFKPRCFFSFGSPMTMFLTLRGIGNISEEYKLPTCDKMFNIFHPYDPLAYRIEPLIDPRFKNIEPVQLPHHRGGKRIHVQLREGFARVGHDIKHRLLGSLRDTWSSFYRFSTTGGMATTSNNSAADANTTTISNSQDTNCSPSVADTSMESNQGQSANRRSRLTKSASSSVDVEVESLESNLIHHMPMNVSASNRQKRQLKRQQQFVRSQSDITNITTLDSILEGSLRQSMEMESDAGSTMMDTLTSNEQTLNESTFGGKLVGDDKTAGTDNNEHLESKSKRSKSKQQKKQRKTGSVSGKTGAEREFDPTKIGKLNGGRRLDYVLQEKPIELFNEYIFAFTSHANYWQNEDSALIILNEIYQTDGIQMFDCFE